MTSELSFALLCLCHTCICLAMARQYCFGGHKQNIQWKISDRYVCVRKQRCHKIHNPSKRQVDFYVFENTRHDFLAFDAIQQWSGVRWPVAEQRLLHSLEFWDGGLENQQAAIYFQKKEFLTKKWQKLCMSSHRLVTHCIALNNMHIIGINPQLHLHHALDPKLISI